MGSSKNVLPVYQILTNQDLGSSFTSGSVGIAYLDNIGIRMAWGAGGGAAGTFSINASLDGTAWSALALSGNPTVAGSADTCLISINQCPFRFLTISYSSGTAGTGSVNAFITAKEIG